MRVNPLLDQMLNINHFRYNDLTFLYELILSRLLIFFSSLNYFVFPARGQQKAE